MRQNGRFRPARTFQVLWLCAALVGPRSMKAASPRPSITPETILKAHRIPITRKAVFSALTSSNAQVRGVAAEVAINRWPKEAIRPVERAMLNESLVWNKIGMASDLFSLGDPMGHEILVNVCHDMTVPGSARMVAANHLGQFKDDSCLDSVFNTLESPTDLRDTFAKEVALELAPELISHMGQQQALSVPQLVIKALGDPWPSIRMNASAMLDQIGYTAAIPSLEVAIAQEKNEGVRRTMLKNLQDLKNRKQRLPDGLR